MADNEQADGAAEGAEAVPAPKGKLKLIIAVVGRARHPRRRRGDLVPVLPERPWRGRSTPKRRAAKPPVFVDVPDMLVNLVGAPGERVQYLKVKVVLEVKEEKQVEAIKPTLPRVTDIFQTYLRELRPTDLNGSAGLFRLKEELTRRVNVAVAPNAVTRRAVQGNRRSVTRRI